MCSAFPRSSVLLWFFSFLLLKCDSCGKSGPAVSTLMWSKNVSIKAQVPQKTEPPNACYFSPSRALRWGINSHRRAGSPEQNWPAHLIFAVSNKQHESAVSCTSTCSRGFECSAFELKTLAWQLEDRPDSGLISWFSKYFWSQRDVSLGDMEAVGPAGSAQFWPLTFVTNMTWHLLAFHLCRRTKKNLSCLSGVDFCSN